MLFPAHPDRSAPEAKIHVGVPGAFLHLGHRSALGAADLADYLLDADLSEGFLALVVKVSRALWPDEGVADLGRTDKDRRARKGLLFSSTA